MKFHEKIQELHDLVNEWAQEVRRELNMVDLPPHLLTSLMEPIPVVKIRDEHKVNPGHYTSNDGSVQVHVLSQDQSTGLMVLEMIGQEENSDERFQTMSPTIFFSLFKQNDSGTYRKEELLEIIQSASDQSPAIQKHLLKEREECFSWAAVQAAHGKMATHYMELYASVLKENKDVVKADYLEFLFLVFVLGNRLGFSPRYNFHALYSGVFALTDRTQEQCQLTKKYYDDQLVETAYEEYRLFDPVLGLSPPVVYYVTVSTKDQVGLDKTVYPKGCFMPSQSIVAQLQPRP